MRAFAYERPAALADAIGLLDRHGTDARLLAGGTDLIIRLRDGTYRPSVVVDVKGIAELDPAIATADGRLRFGALTTMTDILKDERIRRDYLALAEAALFVGSVQIRNRATLAGNMCNASPAADTAPALLAFGAEVVATGSNGTRRIPLDDFFVRSGVTTLWPGELVEAIEVPAPEGPRGSVHLRRTRRRGHDLASVTLACVIAADGVTRLAYGSVGPRPVLAVDDSGLLADPAAPGKDKARLLATMLAGANPSRTSMRASPDYRLAMLDVLALRGVATAIDRLRQATSA
jgi:CO/xanthine dehydrogenase FAD-binding subunit